MKFSWQILYFFVVLTLAAGFTTDVGVDTTEGETTITTTPSPGVTTPSQGTPSPTTGSPPVENTTQGGSGDPLGRTDKIIIGVTCGVVGGAIIGGVSSALVNKRKAQQIAAREKDERGLAKNEVVATEAGQA